METAENVAGEFKTKTCFFNGSRCNLCGGVVPDGDVACVNGHEEGQRYLVPASSK